MTNPRLGDSPLEGALTAPKDKDNLYEKFAKTPVGVTTLGDMHAEVTEEEGGEREDYFYDKTLTLTSDRAPGKKLIASISASYGSGQGRTLSIRFQDADGKTSEILGDYSEGQFSYDVYAKLMTALGAAPSAEETAAAAQRAEQEAIQKAAAAQVRASVAEFLA